MRLISLTHPLCQPSTTTPRTPSLAIACTGIGSVILYCVPWRVLYCAVGQPCMFNLGPSAADRGSLGPEDRVLAWVAALVSSAVARMVDRATARMRKAGQRWRAAQSSWEGTDVRRT